MFQKKTESYSHVAIEAEALALREALECIANIQLPAHWDVATKLFVIQDVAKRSLHASVATRQLAEEIKDGDKKSASYRLSLDHLKCELQDITNVLTARK